jgi:hypothetical protein
MRLAWTLKSTFACLSVAASLAVSPAFARTVEIATQAAYDQHRTATFEAGDRILFKRGQKFVGQFAPKGSGTPKNPITVDAYGEGARPEIGGDVLGERNNSGIILLVNQQGWEFRNLSISNGKVGDVDSGYRSGILFYADKPGTYSHFVIENCRFHNIYGSIGFNPERGEGRFIGKHNGAVMFLVTQQNGEVRVANLRVDKNEFDMVARQAIATRSIPEFVPGATGFRTDPEGRFDGVFVRHNRIMRTAADSVMISNPIGAVLEHNIVGEVGQGWDKYDRRVPAWNGKPKWSRAPYNGLWAYNGADILIQHNEVYGIHDELDGTAFGVDRNSYGTVIQFNYSHDNSGGFFSTFGSASNTIVRNNISYNDHGRLFWFGFHETHDRMGISFTNNLFVTPVGEALTVFEGSNVHAPIFDDNLLISRGGPVTWLKHIGNPNATGPKKVNASPWVTTIESRGFEKGIVARGNRFGGPGFPELPQAGAGDLVKVPDNLPKDAPLGIDKVKALFAPAPAQ